MAPIGNEDFLADIDMLGQQPLLRMYTPLCFFYPSSGLMDKLREIPTIFHQGLQRLSDTFPWISGQVVVDGASEENSGLSTIVSRPSHPIPELIVHHHGLSLPSFDDLVIADFPFGLIDEDILCGRRSQPGDLKDSTTEFPVLVLQINYVEDGIILSFASHHQTMDVMGMGVVLSLFDKACRGEAFTPAELSIGNMPRGNLIPLLDEPVQITPRLKMQITKPSESADIAPAMPPPPTDCTWVYFSFSPSSLSSLKAAASLEIPANGALFVSTDDVLSALIWQSVTRARLPHLDPAETSTLARAIDMRSYLGVPKNYPGMLHNETYTSMLPTELISTPLGTVASQLRQALDPESLARDTRALVTLMTKSKDKGKFSLACGIDWKKDIMLSSWSKVDAYNLEFGIGIKPTKVRRPRLSPVPGLVFVMPKSLEGENSVAICLKDDEMARLNRDEIWSKYATYVG